MTSGSLADKLAKASVVPTEIQCLSIAVTVNSIRQIFDEVKSIGRIQQTFASWATTAFIAAMGFYFGAGYVSQHPAVPLIQYYLPFALGVGLVLALIANRRLCQRFQKAVRKGSAAEKACGSLVDSFELVADDSLFGRWAYTLLYLMLLACTAGVVVLRTYPML